MTRSLILAAAMALIAGFPTECAARNVAEVATPRVSVPLADGWRFFFGETPGGQAPEFDDSGWQSVSLPHTWNRVGFYHESAGPDSHRPETINKAQGIGWYRRSFETPKGADGKRVWLEFDAASRVAEVWLNGRRLGEHRGGFSRFRFDATTFLRQSGPNLLAVKTDNTQPKANSSTSDVFPLAGDFFVHGGLYRPVRLIVTDPVQIDLLDAGGPGAYARTTAISAGSATVDTAIKVRNAGTRRARLTVEAKLVDANGVTAAQGQRSLTLAPGMAGLAAVPLQVANPHLWEGIDDPYLYRYVAEVRSGGKLLDRVAQDFGIRQMRFDPRAGFFLNGKPYKLRGVGYHQDHEGKGWAISEDDVASDLAILKDMGATSIRLTHYQHGEPVHRLADRMGLILWDEVSLVSSWTFGMETEATPARLANAQQQLRELIRQNFNHASVAVWGLANEVDFGNSAPGFIVAPNGKANDPMPMLNELQRVAKAEDPGRSTALATCCEERVFGQDMQIPVTATAADLGGANRYFGWYYGQPSELGPHLDRLRALRPEQPLSVTEFGAGGAITMHSDDPLGGPVDFRGRNQPEEYMNWFHEQNWAQLRDRQDLWATWLWSGFDFATTVRREGDADDINTKGLVTYDRRVKKDPFYYYRAHWSKNPTVHITGRRYIDRSYPVTTVRVYSNAPKTELLVNGRSLGKQGACPNMVCEWTGVALTAGANLLIARGSFDGGSQDDTVTWQLAAGSAQSFRIDSGAIMGGTSSAGRFGSDTFFTGGTAGTVNAPGGYGRPPEKKDIAATDDDVIHATYREGDFEYQIPVQPGTYSLRLSFLEPTERPGARQFDVLANGQTEIAGLDIAAVAGSPLKLVQRSFRVTSTGDGLTLSFRGTRGKALVTAVEVLKLD